MRDLFSSPFRSVRAFVGYTLIFIAPLWAVVTFLGNVDFVMGYSEPIVSFLHGWWGVLALIVAGFALLAWDSHKRHSANPTSPRPTKGERSSPASPSPEPEELERLKAELHKAEQERDSLRSQIQELRTMPPEEFRTLRAERRKRIERWRAEIQRFDFDADNFTGTDAYLEMKGDLTPQVVKVIDPPNRVHALIGEEVEMRRDPRRTLLSEVARIERKWGLI